MAVHFVQAGDFTRARQILWTNCTHSSRSPAPKTTSDVRACWTRHYTPMASQMSAYTRSERLSNQDTGERRYDDKAFI